ncbi:hypothetical protein LTR22_027464, partial [Elasticomyces elasticus]
MAKPLSHFTIPEPYAYECHAKLKELLQAERTHLAFAQLFDNIQLEHAAIEMGDLESFLQLQLPTNITIQAETYAREWLTGQIAQVGARSVASLIAQEALRMLTPNSRRSTRFAALTHGFVLPIVRDCVKRFVTERERDGHTVSGSNFQQAVRNKASAIEAITEWTEDSSLVDSSCTARTTR